MRISCLAPELIHTARAALTARDADWNTHFSPSFRVPTMPVETAAVDPAVDASMWAAVTEHVARAERVGHTLRAGGWQAGVSHYGDSTHAVEIATLISAALQVDELGYELMAALFRCEVDEFIAYGSFLGLLERFREGRGAEVIALYEGFLIACESVVGRGPMWTERVRGFGHGLAGFYVLCGEFDAGHRRFLCCHESETDELLIALTASRVFLAAGAVERAITWLQLGAERAANLGRDKTAERLRQKQSALRARLEPGRD